MWASSQLWITGYPAQENAVINFPSAPRESFWSLWSDYLVSGSQKAVGADDIPWRPMHWPFSTYCACSEPEQNSNLGGEKQSCIRQRTLPALQKCHCWSAQGSGLLPSHCVLTWFHKQAQLMECALLLPCLSALPLLLHLFYSSANFNQI